MASNPRKRKLTEAEVVKVLEEVHFIWFMQIWGAAIFIYWEEKRRRRVRSLETSPLVDRLAAQFGKIFHAPSVSEQRILALAILRVAEKQSPPGIYPRDERDLVTHRIAIEALRLVAKGK